MKRSVQLRTFGTDILLGFTEVPVHKNGSVPDVVIWGERVFRYGENKGVISIYWEARHYVVPLGQVYGPEKRGGN